MLFVVRLRASLMNPRRSFTCFQLIWVLSCVSMVNLPCDAREGVPAGQESADCEFALQQWVRIRDGQLRGALRPPWTSFDSLEGLQIRLISFSDSAVQRSVALEDGNFELSEVVAGPHVFVASGSRLYASFVVHLVDDPSVSGLPDSLDVPLANVPTSAMREFARKHIPAKLAGNEPARPLFSHGRIPHHAAEPGQPAIQLSAGGSISGQLWLPAVGQNPRAPAADMVVAVCLGEQTLATTQCDAEGMFSLRGLSPGIYTFTAAGVDGFVAFGVELLEADATVQQVQTVSSRKSWSQKTEVRHSQYTRKLCTGLNCEVLPLWELVGLNDII